MNPRELARWARICTSNRLINLTPEFVNAGKGGTTFGGEHFCTPPEKLAASLQRAAEVVAEPHPDPACPLFVELCAGTAAVSLRLHSAKARPPVSRQGTKQRFADRILEVCGLAPGAGARAYLWAEADRGARLLLEGYRSPEALRSAAEAVRGWAEQDQRELWASLRSEGPSEGAQVDPGVQVAAATQGRSESRTGLPATIAGDVLSTLPTQAVPEGTVVYIDPPYLGTSGYCAELDRAAVVHVAQAWAGAGARVVVSEATPIPALEAIGWSSVEITRGRGNNFSRQKREHLTVSPEPWRPCAQDPLRHL